MKFNGNSRKTKYWFAALAIIIFCVAIFVWNETRSTWHVEDTQMSFTDEIYL